MLNVAAFFNFFLWLGLDRRQNTNIFLSSASTTCRGSRDPPFWSGDKVDTHFFTQLRWDSSLNAPCRSHYNVTTAYCFWKLVQVFSDTANRIESILQREGTASVISANDNWHMITGKWQRPLAVNQIMNIVNHKGCHLTKSWGSHQNIRLWFIGKCTSTYFKETGWSF